MHLVRSWYAVGTHELQVQALRVSYACSSGPDLVHTCTHLVFLTRFAFHKNMPNIFQDIVEPYVLINEP
jgi:hypothetical protein